MSKKPRTPDPPRKVQAPKVRQRQEQRGRGISMPGTNILISAGLAGIAALVVALIIVLTGNEASASNVTPADVTKARAAMTAAGCTFISQGAAGSQQHMSDPNQRISYRTFPASSGVHDSTTSIWGNYRLPVDPRQAIHNLEHGGIAIWYGPDISTGDREALDDFYDDEPNGLIVSPIEDPDTRVTYPEHEKLGSKIALTVWTQDTDTGEGTVYLATCPSFDQSAFAIFRDTFRGKGPERFPVSQMVPGGQ